MVKPKIFVVFKLKSIVDLQDAREIDKVVEFTRMNHIFYKRYMFQSSMGLITLKSFCIYNKPKELF